MRVRYALMLSLVVLSCSFAPEGEEPKSITAEDARYYFNLFARMVGDTAVGNQYEMMDMMRSLHPVFSNK
ncbi:hypothetical protein ACFL1X_14815, partial [Candidatus Hydrogenedentota bacterium]